MNFDSIAQTIQDRVDRELIYRMVVHYHLKEKFYELLISNEKFCKLWLSATNPAEFCEELNSNLGIENGKICLFGIDISEFTKKEIGPKFMCNKNNVVVFAFENPQITDDVVIDFELPLPIVQIPKSYKEYCELLEVFDL